MSDLEHAKDLATAIWGKHYKEIAPEWEPFDDMLGVLTQIDNMVCGLGRVLEGYDDRELVKELIERNGYSDGPINVKYVSDHVETLVAIDNDCTISFIFDRDDIGLIMGAK